MTSPIFRTWRRRIDSGRFTKSECGQWAKAVVPLSEDVPPQGYRTNLTPTEARELRDYFPEGGVLLTPEHSEQGVTWLSRYAHKAFTPPLPFDLDQFSHFRYTGEAEEVGHNWNTYVPVWTIVNRDGSRIHYAACAWQSGNVYDNVWWRD